MIVKIFTGPLNYDLKTIYKEDRGEYIIGVDMACSLLMENDIPIDLAIGDFDSVREGSMKAVVDYSDKIIIYPTEKDYTDTYLAVQEALAMDHKKIIMYGGVGQRFDHSFANMALLKLGNITIVNEHETMYMLKPGNHKIKTKRKFVSFFAIEEVKGLTLKGFKYRKDGYVLKVDDPLCVSNQGSGTVSFDEGILLVIEQDEDKK